MDTVAEFRKHAANCEKMAKGPVDQESKIAWKRMAERWLLCAKLADDRISAARRHAQNQEKHRGTVTVGLTRNFDAVWGVRGC
jgi:hypothetical protein